MKKIFWFARFSEPNKRERDKQDDWVIGDGGGCIDDDTYFDETRLARRHMEREAWLDRR